VRTDPHQEGAILTGGQALEEATGAVILLHGPGGSAAEMIGLGHEISHRTLLLLAPQASDHAWYPHPSSAPIAKNEPWLTSALNRVSGLLTLCTAYFPSRRIAVFGFSQGASVATEFVVRHPRRYAAVIALSGGLLGPAGIDLKRPGSLEETPALFRSGDPDGQAPWARVEETAQQFRAMQASVTTARFPNRSHRIFPEDLDAARVLLFSAFQP